MTGVSTDFDLTSFQPYRSSRGWAYSHIPSLQILGHPAQTPPSMAGHT